MKRLTGLALLALGLVTVASAGTGYVAHPDAEGTRTLKVLGAVEGYELQDGRVTLLVRDGRTCRRVTWKIEESESAVPAACARAGQPSSEARSGATRVRLRPGAWGHPDRLVVTGPSGIRSWPLPERALHVDVDGQTAIFSTRASREVYAVDLQSGRTALVGLTRRGDTPRLNRRGLVFRDNVYKRRETDGSTLMKFVPRRHLDKATRLVGEPLRVDGRIVDLAMDGSRVALAVREWRGGCDAVVYWNIAWRYAIPITEEEELTCAWSRRGGTIETVSLAGLRAAWVMRVGSEQRLLAASSVDCFERRVVTAQMGARERVIDHSGDSGLLAYTVARRGGSVLGKLDGRMRGDTLVSDKRMPTATAVDKRRVAVLFPNGTVELRIERGAVTREIVVGSARALALQAKHLVVLTHQDTLAVFSTETGRRLSSWSVPRGVSARIDAHFGVAVLTRGKLVLAVSLRTGKRIIVARTPTAATAAIEAPGIAYASSLAARATVGFVPFARIERLLAPA